MKPTRVLIIVLVALLVAAAADGGGSQKKDPRARGIFRVVVSFKEDERLAEAGRGDFVADPQGTQIRGSR